MSHARDEHQHHEHQHHEHSENDEHRHHEHEHVDYGDAVRSFRADKDAFFRTNTHSPLPAAEREGFEGLQ